MTRVILHADMDAFFAAVEQRDDPALRGRPVVVGGLGKRGVVSTASYEARAFGIRSAMPTATARRLCPAAVFVQPRHEVYAAISAEIREIFESYTPLVEPLSLDEAFLDVTGSLRLFESGASIAKEIRRRVLERTGLVVSVGVASSKYVAKVASDLDKPDGLRVVPEGGEIDFLTPLPVSRLWGAGPRAVEKLERVGIRTIGQLREAGAATLRTLLGATSAAHFLALAEGRDERPVVAEREAKTIGNERTFQEDLRDVEACRGVLLALSESVGRRLRRAGFLAGTVRLKLRYPDFETHTRQTRLAEALSDDRRIYEAARSLLDQGFDFARGARLLGVTAADLVREDAPRQLDLFASAPPKDGPLSRTLDDIRERFGRDLIARGRLRGAEPSRLDGEAPAED